MTITVVGGGLGGLVAAITSAEAGADVELFEAHSSLGGRARSTREPYVANEGTRVFYGDGPTWRWLKKRRLAGPAVSLGIKELRRFRFRYGGTITPMPPRALGVPAMKRRLTAPVEQDFHSWASERFSEQQARVIEGLLGVVIYDADPGRLSAAFVWERFRRVTAPRLPAPRYVIGGWQAVVDRLEAHARGLGVSIQTNARVETLPEGAVIVATHLAAARTLLDDDTLRGESGHTVLVDIGMKSHPGDPFVVSDIDEGGFVERYSLPDPSLAPAGHSLVQAQMPVRAGESKAAAVARLEAVLDQAFAEWRTRTTWRRDAVARGRTGALDLPGRRWRDRPAVDRGGGAYVVGDQMAAPGLLSEVAFTSALEAARGAVEVAGVDRGRAKAS